MIHRILHFGVAALALSGLLAGPAAAVTTTVTFSAGQFADGRNGTVSGHLVVEDLDKNGRIRAAEVLDFAFSSDFADATLDFIGNPASHSIFDLTPPVPGILVPGLDFSGFGFIGLGSGGSGLGGGPGFDDVTLLALSGSGLDIARLSPGNAVASSVGAPSLSAVPLPASLGLLLGGFAVLIGLGWRRTLSRDQTPT